MLARRTLGPILLLLTVSSGPAWAGDGRLTLEAIFADEAFESPNPTHLRWLPDGDEVLMRVREEGRTWLVREDATTGKRRRVVDWNALMAELESRRPAHEASPLRDVNAADDARLEPDLSPDGRVLVGVAADDLFRLDLDTGEARFLVETGGKELFPTFSPDGSRLAFVRAGDLWWLDLATGRQHRLTDRDGVETLLNGVADWVYEEELGVTRSFWWSPRGDRILFRQLDLEQVGVVPITDDIPTYPVLERQRYPKAGDANARPRLGVVGLDGGEPAWIDVGPDADGYLPRAGWTPGGSRVWYQWLNRDQTRLELRLADPATGTSRDVLSERQPTWVNVGDALLFVNDTTLVWGSERDGRRHLYLYRTDGTLIRRLTSGAWQVEELYGLDDSGRRLVAQGTGLDPRERHLYSVPLDGSGASRSSATSGDHSAILSPDGSLYVQERSDLVTPPRLDVMRSDGRRVRVLADGAIPALEGLDLQPYELGTLEADDGTVLYTCMLRPPGTSRASRHPALLYVYGGPHAQLVQDSWGGSRHLFLQLLAREGLVVLWLDNRGTWGRGHAFEAAVHRRLGEVELRDQLVGARHLESLDFVDPERIGVYGGSYGGFMALTAMLRAPERFRAGIAYAPVTDWRLYDTVYTERYMDRPSDNPEGYRRAAPLTWADRLRGELLLVHGAMDNNVHLQQTLQLVERLAGAGRPFQLMVYPRVRHMVRTSQFKLHFHRMKLDFLRRHLLSNEKVLD